MAKHEHRAEERKDVAKRIDKTREWESKYSGACWVPTLMSVLSLLRRIFLYDYF